MDFFLLTLDAREVAGCRCYCFSSCCVLFSLWPCIRDAWENWFGWKQRGWERSDDVGMWTMEHVWFFVLSSLFFELRLVRWFFPLFLLHFLRDKFSCCLLSEWWRAEGELLRWKTYVQCKLLFGELVERSNSPLQHRRVEENKKPNVFLMTISQSLYWDQA